MQSLRCPHLQHISLPATFKTKLLWVRYKRIQQHRIQDKYSDIFAKLYIKHLFELDYVPDTYIEPLLGEPLKKIYQEQRSLLLASSANAKIFTSKNHFEQWQSCHKDDEFHKRYVLHLSFFFFLKKSLLWSKWLLTSTLYRRTNIKCFQCSI